MRIYKVGLSLWFFWFIPFGMANQQFDISKMSAELAKHDYEKDTILITQYHHANPADVAKLHEQIGAEVIHSYQHLQGLELIRLPSDVSIVEAVEFYSKDPDILAAEPNYLVYTTGMPNDPLLTDTWGLNNSGQYGGTADVDINASEMWNVSVGSANTIIAVIDTGIEYTHPDISANMWTNRLEIPNNGIDDDQNGYVDDVYGINATNNSGNPLDDHGHGTHVAGVIAARGNNGIGISGVMQQASLIACKFLTASGSGSLGDALKCMDYLLALSKRSQSPVSIVATNNSWGGGGFVQAFQNAINQHNQAGILFIAAAGNYASNNDTADFYPANYKVANVISVAAIDRTGALASFSNYGNNSVHVAAPGVNIYSTYVGSTYVYLSGTSMATPFVSGLAGLTKSWNPGLSAAQIRNLIISSGVPAQAYATKTISGRRIRGWDNNGRGTTTCSNQLLRKRLLPTTTTVMVPVNTAIPLSVYQLNCANPFGPAQITVRDTGAKIDLKDDGQSPDAFAGDAIFSGSFTPTTRGIFDLLFPDNSFVYVGAYVLNSGGGNAYQSTVLSQPEYITIQGTGLNMGDDTVASITSPFPIKFANDPTGFTAVYVGSNGLVSFSNNAVASYQNTNLPNSSMQTVVAPFWDDLIAKPASGSDVFWAVTGSAPNRQLVIEWRNIAGFSVGGAITFQIVFYEGNANVQFNYLDVTANNATFDGGASATVGVQVAGDKAALFSFNRAALVDRMSVRFSISG